MRHEETEANSLTHSVKNGVKDKLVSTALQEFDGIGIREILEADARPTFVCDMDPALELPLDPEVLTPYFSNAALRTFEQLWDAVCGTSDHRQQYLAFRTWALSRSPHDESGDVFPSTHVFFGILWVGTTVRKRWRLISGNHYHPPPSLDTRNRSMDPPNETAAGSYSQRPPGSPGKRLRSARPVSVKRQKFEPTNVTTLHESSQFEATGVLSSERSFARGTEMQESSYSSVGLKSNSSLDLDVDHVATDWTAANPQGALSEHILFARSIDWGSTPLGAMKDWTPEFRQVANLVMKNPHSCALFWGDDLTMLYNWAYATGPAGRKHPALMGTGFQGPFKETWDELADLFRTCARTGVPISEENQLLKIERQGFLEEVYFTWSFTPLYGAGKILGFYNAPFETTEHQINRRRTHTLRRLDEETALSKTVATFWQQVLRGLEENVYDIPLAILYSVADADDEESSLFSGSSAASLKSLVLEGSLGVPDGHPAAPARLDLKRSTEGFVPSFREAMRTREPMRLQTRDGTLPAALLEGIEWRGFDQPCREGLIFPLRPTNGENVLAFLLVGNNPLRPFDDSYKAFVNMLNRQLSTGLASVLLYEEEVRRGQTAAEAAAKEREALSEQLAAQTLRLQKMAEVSTVGHYWYDITGTLIEANERYYEITGHGRINDAGPVFMDIVHPDSIALALHSWHQYTVENVAWSGELRYKKPWVDPVTGEVLDNWCLASGIPELYPDGSLRSVMGTITDISKIKWAEGLQTARLYDAEETRRQTNNFLDLTSHEMRNPLSAMTHCSDEISSVLHDVLAGTFDSNNNKAVEQIKECIEAAETIAICASHQKSIVDDILTVSKLDSDLLLITPTPTQPMALIRQTVKMFDAELQKKDIKCDCQVDSSITNLDADWVLLDRSRVMQVLINLLTNAIKFTQAETERNITVRVGASLSRPSHAADFDYIASKASGARNLDSDEWGTGQLLYLQLEVRDTGRGLTKDEKNRLFIRFSQATPRTHAQYGGSGLGLFISRQLTELHGGQIGVGSEAGVGSTFGFYVQCRRTTVVNKLEHITAVKPINTLEQVLPIRTSTTPIALPKSPVPLDYKELHVLIVEDNLVNQKVLSRQLTKLGCNVEVADHGGLALAHLQTTCYWKGNPDGNKLSVVLMDLEMPVMDGLTCVKNIRELQRQGQIIAHLPVIAVTANVRRELVDVAKESGMDKVLNKPFRVNELTEMIRELLDL